MAALFEGNNSLDTVYVDEMYISSGGQGNPPGQASNPNPSNGATGVSTSANLAWSAGNGADSHDVYFGTDSTPDAGEFQGKTDLNMDLLRKVIHASV